MTGATATLVPLVFGPLGAPPVLVVGLLVLLLAALLGRVVLGVAWKLLLVALVAALGLLVFDVLSTVLVSVP